MNSKVLIIVFMIVILVIGAAGYYGYSVSAQTQPTLPAPQTATVTKCDIKQTVEAPGVLDNTSETQVLMPVDGSLSQVSVQPGDHVAAGQILASMDNHSEAEARIALKAAKEADDKATDYLHYLQTSQRVPQSESRLFLETRRNSWMYVYKTKTFRGPAPADWITDAENDLALKQAELEDAQATLDQMELKAPFSGVVIEVNAATDQVYHENDVLFTIIDPKSLEVKTNITQEDYPLLKSGQRAEIYFDARPDVTAQGKVDRIVPKLIAGDSPTYDIFLSLDEVPDGLVEGMTVDTNLTIASHSGVLCLPRNVVHASGDDRVVLQVLSGEQVENREVQIGLRGDANVEILSGLQDGEQVVLR